MAGLGFQRKSMLSSSLVSLVIFSLSQLSIAMVPRFLPWLSLLGMLPVSGLVLLASLGFGRFFRRLLGVSQSAPAMVVFHLLFLWGVYVVMIREAVPSLLDATINAEFGLLLFGLYRILSGDPGLVANDSSSALHSRNGLPESNIYENSSMFSRVRYCKICKTSVRGFDHHCSAFGNCIGQKNQRLFMMLLVGFIIAEASYIISSTQYIAKSLSTDKIGFKNDIPGNVVISTLLFAVLQLLWQVVFLIWNIYCICANIKTDEWINWKKYPEFQLVVQSQPGNSSEVRFSNPYDKGIISNIKDFINPMEYSLHVIHVLS
ncbi:uncharacterized protein A4U43_C07F2420 [Asparagus officinalis]|uniref:S-acyltransferase n=1 Tax=Asparagus officinalis TaxID=4686 RepID=A0A5P1E8Z5_ASPOF|nr:palmitoyltransferase ZDHHC17-like [Asparagus officinalis]ONK62294.1 uncharacterized protein A4U43_C07F2420 [Asparagus officinalis]